MSPALGRRGREAIDFDKAAFGAIEVYHVAGTDELGELVAQLAPAAEPLAPTQIVRRREMEIEL